MKKTYRFVIRSYNLFSHLRKKKSFSKCDNQHVFFHTILHHRTLLIVVKTLLDSPLTIPSILPSPSPLPACWASVRLSCNTCSCIDCVTSLTSHCDCSCCLTSVCTSFTSSCGNCGCSNGGGGVDGNGNNDTQCHGTL